MCNDCIHKMKPKFDEISPKINLQDLVDFTDLYQNFKHNNLPDTDRADFIELKYLKALEM
jgi:hypothetical protein